MILKDVSFCAPEENILFDEVLLALAEKGLSGEVLRLWEFSSVCIVLGRTSKVVEEVRLDNVLFDHIPVLSRSSGGGTVVQGKGCLNYSLVLSKEKYPKIADLGKSYSFILNKIILILKKLNIDAVFRPISDLAFAANEKKISGNAQKRGRRFILHHGTLLYDFDISLMERYLEMPPRVPDYRCNRAHSEFVSNIPVSYNSIREGFIKEFDINEVEPSLNEHEKCCLKNFAAKRNIVFNEKQLTLI